MNRTSAYLATIVLATGTFAACAIANAQTLVRTVPVGNGPSGMVANSYLGKVYVANQSGSSVSVLDVATATTAAPIATGAGVRRLTFDTATHRTVTANATANTATVFDAETGTVLATIPTGANPRNTNVNRVRRLAYIPSSGGTALTEINIDTLTSRSIEVGAGASEVDSSATHDRLLVARSSANELTIVKMSTGEVLADIDAGGPQYINLDFETGRGWAANNGGSSVTVVDMLAAQFVKTIEVGQKPFGLVSSGCDGRTFVTNNGEGTVSVIDEATLTHLGKIGVGTAPTFLTFDADDRVLYVVNNGSKTVSVIDLDTLAVVNTLAVGNNPQQVRIAQGSGTKRVFVTNQNDDTVSVFESVSLKKAGGRNCRLPVVEFYNAGVRQGHYFHTASAQEVAGIDAGTAGPGWTRTGATWEVFGGHGAATCRFYAFGPNSHFFTVDFAECLSLRAIEATQRAEAQTAGQQFLGWGFEGYGYYARAEADAKGRCPFGSAPLYRSWSRSHYLETGDSNHRLTPSQATQQQMTAQGWSDEGVAMCLP